MSNFLRGLFGSSSSPTSNTPSHSAPTNNLSSQSSSSDNSGPSLENFTVSVGDIVAPLNGAYTPAGASFPLPASTSLPQEPVKKDFFEEARDYTMVRFTSFFSLFYGSLDLRCMFRVILSSSAPALPPSLSEHE